MLDQADEDIGLLARMQVLHLDQTERAKRLNLRWRYYEQRQHDDAEHEYDGRPRQRGLTYFASKQQALGFSTIQQATAVSYGQRRPSCPTVIGGTTVDTYTAMLLGGGRQPAAALVCRGDAGDFALHEAHGRDHGRHRRAGPSADRPRRARACAHRRAGALGYGIHAV